MISSIDSVLVRAAASSIASGRPSSDRHSSSTASSIVAEALVLALRGGATGEQLGGVAERERCELEQGFAVDVEWHLAGAQDPHAGGGVEQPDREFGGRVDDVFAVVEDDQRVAALEPLVQRGFAAGDVHRGDQRVDDVVGGRRRFRVSPARRHRARPACDMVVRPIAIASAVLPMPPGPTISTSRLSASSVGQRRRARRRGRRARLTIDGRFPAATRSISVAAVRTARWSRRGSGSVARAAAVAALGRGRARRRVVAEPAGRSPARRPGARPGTGR